MGRKPWVLALASVMLAACSPHYYRVAERQVTLYLKAPRAARVQLATSGDGFRPREAHRLPGGTWRASVSPVAGFSYFYLVDGKVFTPDCRLRERDDFGAQNCVFQPPR